MSTFRRSLVATYASQIYVAVTGIVIVPVYIRYMGTEAYGLVGFYAMLQACFQMLDMGLSPTLSRQTARLSGGAITSLELRRLLRVLEGIFYGVALLGTLAIGLSADWIATRWLQAQSLPLDQVRLSIELMACIVGLRWVAGLYRGAIGGFEQQVWLGKLNAAAATARFVLVLGIFEWFGKSPAHFFGWQFLVATVETTTLLVMTYRLLPPIAPTGESVGWHWNSVRKVIGFSLSIAFTSAIWVSVTQTDKLMLSKILPLAEYGYFTVSILLASGIMMISAPISNSLMPRMARLHAEGAHTQVIDIYRKATRLVAMTALPVALILSLFSKEVLWAWAGDEKLVEAAALTLSLYAAGYGVLAISAFPYYLQYAKGDVRLHLIGNILLVVTLIPALIFSTQRSGMTGAGWSWLVCNALYLLAWTPLVHRRFAPNLHLSWLLSDVLRPIWPALVLGITAANYFPWSIDRTHLVVELIVTGALLIGANVTTSRAFKKNA
ncbi:MAG: hypothetical protein RJA34_455 [Pseudomonadota bacterium]|jgi:O-antigen/teichoic acid export membrane protein